MSGRRLIVGLIVMGVAVPATLFFLLHLDTVQQFFTIAVTTFLSWGMADLLANILQKPRLRDRTPGKALGEEWDRRSESERVTGDK
ncbi:MAG: hypothetical protein JJE51_07210 [Thermoanaerobaculia bacterium]|nr:hypothetical protein [Thermoanaerobaculia bacterium]